jgi:hypothetical protein
MEKIRLMLMFQGRVEYDFETKMKKPILKEIISIEKEENCLHYDVEFIQHFFNEQGEFLYIMVTGIRKS